MNFHPQIITKNNSPEYVILPYLEYEEILAVLEDREDIRSIDEFHAGDQETFPAEVVHNLAVGLNPIKVFREFRKISQAQLAKKVGISRQYLNQLENKKRQGNIELFKKLSETLNVAIDLLA